MASAGRANDGGRAQGMTNAGTTPKNVGEEEVIRNAGTRCTPQTNKGIKNVIAVDPKPTEGSSKGGY